MGLPRISPTKNLARRTRGKGAVERQGFSGALANRSKVPPDLENETAALGVGAQNGGYRNEKLAKPLHSFCPTDSAPASAFALIGSGGIVLALAASAAEARALLRAGGPA